VKGFSEGGKKEERNDEEEEGIREWEEKRNISIFRKRRCGIKGTV